MKDAFFRGAIAKECGNHSSLAFTLASQRVTKRDGNGGAHDGRSAEDVLIHADQVHGPALSAGAPGVLAVELGDHGVEVAALGQICGVPPVARRDYIIGAQHNSADGAS